jgi:hypothetical protein
MLMFQALLRHCFDDDFTYQQLSKMPHYIRQEYHGLLRLFQDNGMDAPYPFSIHNIAKEGAKMGRNPGDWYGPQAIMVVLKKLQK